MTPLMSKFRVRQIQGDGKQISGRERREIGNDCLMCTGFPFIRDENVWNYRDGGYCTVKALNTEPIF